MSYKWPYSGAGLDAALKDNESGACMSIPVLSESGGGGSPSASLTNPLNTPVDDERESSECERLKTDEELGGVHIRGGDRASRIATFLPRLSSKRPPCSAGVVLLTITLLVSAGVLLTFTSINQHSTSNGSDSAKSIDDSSRTTLPINDASNMLNGEGAGTVTDSEQWSEMPPTNDYIPPIDEEDSTETITSEREVTSRPDFANPDTVAAQPDPSDPGTLVQESPLDDPRHPHLNPPPPDDVTKASEAYGGGMNRDDQTDPTSVPDVSPNPNLLDEQPTESDPSAIIPSQPTNDEPIDTTMSTPPKQTESDTTMTDGDEPVPQYPSTNVDPTSQPQTSEASRVDENDRADMGKPVDQDMNEPTTPLKPDDSVTPPTTSAPYPGINGWMYEMRLAWLDAHGMTPFKRRFEEDMIRWRQSQREQDPERDKQPVQMDPTGRRRLMASQSNLPLSESNILSSYPPADLAPSSYRSAWDIRLWPLVDAHVHGWIEQQDPRELESIIQRLIMNSPEHLARFWNQTAGSVEGMDIRRDSNKLVGELIDRLHHQVHAAKTFLRLDPSYLEQQTSAPSILQVRSLLYAGGEEQRQPEPSTSEGDLRDSQPGPDGSGSWRLVIYELSYETDFTAPDIDAREKDIEMASRPRLSMLVQLLPPREQPLPKEPPSGILDGLTCQILLSSQPNNMDQGQTSSTEQQMADTPFKFQPIGQKETVHIRHEGNYLLLLLSCPLPALPLSNVSANLNDADSNDDSGSNSTNKSYMELDLASSSGLVVLSHPSLFSYPLLVPFGSIPTPRHEHTQCIRPLEHPRGLHPSMALQWMEYHLFLGMDHLYITDRDGTYAEALRPLIEAGVASYRVWPGNHPSNVYDRLHMIYACQMFSKRAGRVAHYLDPDEYLYPLPCHYSASNALTAPCVQSSFAEMPDTATQDSVKVAEDGMQKPKQNNCSSVLSEYWRSVEEDGGAAVIFPNVNFVLKQPKHVTPWNPARDTDDGVQQMNASNNTTIVPWWFTHFTHRKQCATGRGKPSSLIRGTTRVGPHWTQHKLGRVLDPSKSVYACGQEAAMVGMERGERSTNESHDTTVADGDGVEIGCQSTPKSASIRLHHYSSLIHDRDRLVMGDPRGGGNRVVRDSSQVHMLPNIESWLNRHPLYGPLRHFTETSTRDG